jgi:hypothetical protein
VKWIREKVADWIWKLLMAKKPKNTALVHSPDPDKIASELEDMESLAQKVTSSEVKAKKSHDWIRRYRSWRHRMLAMEQEFWKEGSLLLGEIPDAEDPDED